MGSTKIRKLIIAFALVATSSVFALPVSAGTPSDCTDLDVFPPQDGVDFGSRIEPIFSVCSGCHGDGGPAGLDLRPGQAYGNLVGIESTTNPPLARVQPFEPGASVLLNAVNCSAPGGPAFQMPGAEPAERALIRDWIAQGALARAPARSIPILDPFGIGVLVVLIMLLTLASRHLDLRTRR